MPGVALGSTSFLIALWATIAQPYGSGFKYSFANCVQVWYVVSFHASAVCHVSGYVCHALINQLYHSLLFYSHTWFTCLALEGI